MAEAAVEVFGLPPSTDEAAIRAVEPWGKTDRWILRELLEAHGIGAPGRADVERWERAACAAYERFEDGEPSDDDVRTRTVLDRLAADGHELALVTGNLEPIARRKLGARGLGEPFAPGRGGFGSDAEDRADLVRIALARSGADASAAALIGDTPNDVAAGLAAQVRTIALAGARFDRDALRAAGAHEVIDDLDELRLLI